MQERDVVIVGGGPAGYVAAMRASQLGAKVTLVEKEKLGGACLHRACIPTKFLLHVVDTYHSIKDAGKYGVEVASVKIDLARVQSRKNAVISILVDGLQGLMEANRVEVITGSAWLTPSNRVEVDSGQGVKETFPARRVILATGSRPIALRIPGADAADILKAENILTIDRVPKSLVMIGGGVVGVEMAAILAGLGCKVSIVEIMPHLLPNEDAELAAILERALKRNGIQIYTGARVTNIETTQGNKQVVMTTGQAERKLEAETVAIAVGQKPYVEGLGLAECGVAMPGGRIQTNERMETSMPNVYAAGDVTSRWMLACVAMTEGRVAAENALGGDSKVDYEVVPRCIFSLPEMASVGLTEDEATSRGYQIRCGHFPFSANSMATILGERRGVVKIVTEEESGRVLGVHIIGPGAVSLIAEATLAVKMGATAEDIGTTIHAHPTLSEALWEAALDVSGEAIDFTSPSQ